MLFVVSLGCAVLTTFMAVLHILLLVGMPIGEYVLGGKDKVIPREKRYINAIFASVFFLFGIVYFQKAGLLSLQLPGILSKIIMIVYTLFLAYAIIGNTFFTNSKKEKNVMIPASVLGFSCSLMTVILSW